jgi:hypothetical protein
MIIWRRKLRSQQPSVLTLHQIELNITETNINDTSWIILLPGGNQDHRSTEMHQKQPSRVLGPTTIRKIPATSSAG